MRAKTLLLVRANVQKPGEADRRVGPSSPETIPVGKPGSGGCLSEPREKRFSGIHEDPPRLSIAPDAASELHMPFAQAKGVDDLLARAATSLLDREADARATASRAVGVKDSIVVHQGEAIAPQASRGDALGDHGVSADVQVVAHPIAVAVGHEDLGRAGARSLVKHDCSCCLTGTCWSTR